LKVSARLKRPVVAVLLALSLAAATSEGQIDTGITGFGPKAVRIAVADLKFVAENAQTAQLTRVFNETLVKDLDFSGNLELASRSFFPPGTFALPADIKPDDWRPTSAQYVVYGSLALNGNRFSATGFMRDLNTDTDSLSRAPFAGTYDEDGARLAAHRLADKILETLGFGKGIAETQIAFVSNRTGQKEIYVMDYDGNNPRKLTAIRNIAMAPSWSPVDDRIAYTAWRADGTQPRIEILSASGERQNFAQATGFSNRIPSWSNDGKSIVYTSNRDGNSEIYWANADGSEPRRLTSNPRIDMSPSINPATGRQIAFISNRDGTPQLYTMDSDGTNVARITVEGGDAENPAYSPDGKMIAFAWQKPRSGGFDIYLYNVGMRNFSQLTSDSGSNERPTWAPDGKHLAFVSNRTGNSQIYAMTVDGKKVRQLTNTAGINEGPTWSGFTAR
jgi:TolB protein